MSQMQKSKRYHTSGNEYKDNTSRVPRVVLLDSVGNLHSWLNPNHSTNH